ncbi:class IIb bacteriocin, lactobin A/cerein 7B family [Neisseria sp.]|uniref:class IIb bacteriocin, lactobin A/cerein 7B family n=1 Tax=Neisseria sp. TaxID=192066 RepID=UPI0034C5DC1A
MKELNATELKQVSGGVEPMTLFNLAVGAVTLLSAAQTHRKGIKQAIRGAKRNYRTSIRNFRRGNGGSAVYVGSTFH